MKKLILVLCSVFAFPLVIPVMGQTTANSDPIGFSKVTLPIGDSLVVPTLLNPAVFTGNATLVVDGSTAPGHPLPTTVTPATAPGWTLNTFAESQYTDRANYPRYYVEVVEGAYEGYSFDIISNSVTALTVPAGYVPAQLNSQTVKVVLRRHITLDDLSVGSTGLSAYADAITSFNSDGTSSAHFFDGASWIADDFSTPAGHTIVYPGTGFTFSSANGGQMVLNGPVKTTKTAIPLYAGATNIVGPLNPAAQTVLVNCNIAAALDPYSEGFSTYSSDGTMTALSSYFSDGANLLDGSFNFLPANALDNILGNRGIVVTDLSSDKIWISKSPLAP